MKNLYNLRKDKGLLYIYPDKGNSMLDSCVMSQVVIIVHLYYIETLECYCQYINRMPQEIKILCVSSRQEVLDQTRKFVTHKNIEYVIKDNRGRDVSALLVTVRETVRKYKYFCWIHDKKSKFLDSQVDIDKWITGLWDNMVLSSGYICSVIHEFENNEKLGMLLPPEPAGEYTYAWYGDAWSDDKNYVNCKHLIDECHLNVDIDREIPPLLGTTMWARTKCLEKLFQKDWSYDHFSPEPMPNDGTISHALERCYPYFAQDAGFDVGTVMCEHYASWLLLWAQDNMRYLFKYVSNELGVNSLHQFRNIKKQEELLNNIFKNNKKIYFFGTGIYARNLLIIAKRLGYMPDGFVVSDGKRTESKVEECKVFELNEILDDKVFIVIATSYAIQDEIAEVLDNKGFHDFVRGVL